MCGVMPSSTVASTHAPCWRPPAMSRAPFWMASSNQTLHADRGMLAISGPMRLPFFLRGSPAVIESASSAKPFDKAVGDVFMHDDTFRGHADLFPGRRRHRRPRARAGFFDIGVIEDDHRRLAAEFQAMPSLR